MTTTVVPDGLPAIARASSIETFGGSTTKKNYNNVGVVDPDTDESAEQFSRMVDILQAVEKTAPFAVLTYNQVHEEGEDIITVEKYLSMYGSAPTLESNDIDGDVTTTWEASYVDSYGVEETFTISQVQVTVVSGDSSTMVPVIEQGDNYIRVAVKDMMSNADASNNTVTISIW